MYHRVWPFFTNFLLILPILYMAVRLTLAEFTVCFSLFAASTDVRGAVCNKENNLR